MGIQRRNRNSEDKVKKISKIEQLEWLINFYKELQIKIQRELNKNKKELEKEKKLIRK